MTRHLRIGLSAAFMHADPQRALFKGKTLKYVEQELSNWVMAEDALAYLIPSPSTNHTLALDAYAIDLDGLVLQGGVDVAPESYGEKAIQPEWSGDRIRDDYEISLINAFLELGKPVLGICRGLQILNVSRGGTLYQDIATQLSGSTPHRQWDIYDQNFHHIRLSHPSYLSELYPDTATARVCSVHHQAIKDLGKDLVVEAQAVDDNVIEAIRLEGSTWAYGVQWHPEWHDAKDASLMDGRVLLQAFLTAARKRRNDGRPPDPTA